MITLTEKAANKIKELFNYQNVPKKSQNFRVQISGGGCSGFQYHLKFGEIQLTDQVFEHHGVKVICDPKSYIYLAGSEVDYSDDLMHNGFGIKNPNAKGSCGCGSSFNA